MTTVTLVFPPTATNLGERLRADLTASGITVLESVPTGNTALLVIMLAGTDTQTQQAAISAAADQHQHIIPVLARQATLPRMIDNLQPLDFSAGYNFEALHARIEALSAPDAPPPLTVLTPSKQQQNRRAGLWLGVPVAIMFLAAIFGIVQGITVPPEDEFASVDTQVYLTQRFFIDGALPQGTEQAANFPATVEEIPTRARMEAIMTATAIAAGVDGTFVPRSTAEATAFEATLRHVSTHVQDRLAASATFSAGTAAVITATPTPAP